MTGRGLLATALLVGLAVTACDRASDDGGATRRPTSAPTEPATSTSPGVVPASSPVDELVGVGDARQVVSVIAADAGDTTAVLHAYESDGQRWRLVFGPWRADVGARGFAPVDAKREGDRRTPSGSYAFDFFFGVLPDPGVRYAYRDITGRAIVWDDDPASPRYNLWTDTTELPAGNDPEPMYNIPAYNHGAVIAYNTARTPGLGSAIFLHVSTGGPTAGCVALPQGQLVDILRWLDPAARPRIVMGTVAEVTTRVGPTSSAAR